MGRWLGCCRFPGSVNWLWSVDGVALRSWASWMMPTERMNRFFSWVTNRSLLHALDVNTPSLRFKFLHNVNEQCLYYIFQVEVAKVRI